jgi:hypothetical protein
MAKTSNKVTHLYCSSILHLVDQEIQINLEANVELFLTWHSLRQSGFMSTLGSHDGAIMRLESRLWTPWPPCDT